MSDVWCAQEHVRGERTDSTNSVGTDLPRRLPHTMSADSNTPSLLRDVTPPRAREFFLEEFLSNLERIGHPDERPRSGVPGDGRARVHAALKERPTTAPTRNLTAAPVSADNLSSPWRPRSGTLDHTGDARGSTMLVVHLCVLIISCVQIRTGLLCCIRP